MTERVFVDTNVLVYSFDLRNGKPSSGITTPRSYCLPEMARARRGHSLASSRS
jgi:hypothetical protein